MTEKKKRNQYAYDKKAYDHLHIQVPKGQKAALQAYVEAHEYESLNAYIKALIERDSGLPMDAKKAGE